MLKIITSGREICRCQRELKKMLITTLTSSGNYTIGYHSGSVISKIYLNSRIWFSPSIVHSGDKRYWNAFGLSKHLSKTKSNSIAVEINILRDGVNGRVAGAFAIDKNTDDIYLTHSGKVGGGRRGIGKNTFVKWYKKQTKALYGGNGKPRMAIVIGNIASSSFTSNLTKFIQSVSMFKDLVAGGEVSEATILSNEELEIRAQKESSNRKPKTSRNTVTTYKRNIYVAELARRNAKGICQLCGEVAPFKNKARQPYLETHHIVWLSKGGTDSVDNTVALCPNCHKKMHIVNSSSDVRRLKNAGASK